MNAVVSAHPTDGDPASIRPRFAKADEFRKRAESRVAAYFRDNDLSPHGGWRMALKTVLLFAWFGASYAALVFVATTWWHGALAAASLAFAVAGIGFSIQHDANHGAYSHSSLVNRALERSLDFLGASSYLWRWKHNVFHHTYTNVVGADHDIALAPFARLAPTQPWRRAHRLQHIYMWAVYGFTVFHMHFVEDFYNVASGRVGDHRFPRPRGVRLFEVYASKAVVLGWAVVVPLLFHSWWVVLAFYAAGWFLVGLILGIVFQVAHCYEGAAFPVPAADGHIDNGWAVHQVETTANFAPDNRLINWYVGGLNFQIEHHLFPKVCHIHYPQIARIVRELCAEHGIRYTSFPTFASAVASHGRQLRRMAAEPALLDGRAEVCDDVAA